MSDSATKTETIRGRSWADLFGEMTDFDTTVDEAVLRQLVLQIREVDGGGWNASVRAYEDVIDGISVGVFLLMSADGETKAEALTKCEGLYRSFMGLSGAER